MLSSMKYKIESNTYYIGLYMWHWCLQLTKLSPITDGSVYFITDQTGAIVGGIAVGGVVGGIIGGIIGGVLIVTVLMVIIKVSLWS